MSVEPLPIQRARIDLARIDEQLTLLTYEKKQIESFIAGAEKYLDEVQPVPEEKK